jgi:hypothetical protein
MTDILNDPIQIDNPSANTDAVRIAMLIDESGSMLGAADDTIKNINGYLDEQATSDKVVLVSLYTFSSDTGVKERFVGVNAKEAPRMSRVATDSDMRYVYRPSGGTPLYDAIGKVVSLETKDDVPTLVVILTDGAENASKELRTRAQVQEVISQQEEKGWSFVWLMAGLSLVESVNYATSIMGRSYEGATMAYAKGMEAEAFRGLASSTATWDMAVREIKTAGGPIDAQGMTQNFFDNDVRDIKKEPKKSK